MGALLSDLYDAQLEGQVTSAEEAQAYVERRSSCRAP
jgi:hypothetical protein